MAIVMAPPPLDLVLSEAVLMLIIDSRSVNLIRFSHAREFHRQPYQHRENAVGARRQPLRNAERLGLVFKHQAMNIPSIVVENRFRLRTTLSVTSTNMDTIERIARTNPATGAARTGKHASPRAMGPSAAESLRRAEVVPERTVQHSPSEANPFVDCGRKACRWGPQINRQSRSGRRQNPRSFRRDRTAWRPRVTAQPRTGGENDFHWFPSHGSDCLPGK